MQATIELRRYFSQLVNRKVATGRRQILGVATMRAAGRDTQVIAAAGEDRATLELGAA